MLYAETRLRGIQQTNPNNPTGPATSVLAVLDYGTYLNTMKNFLALNAQMAPLLNEAAANIPPGASYFMNSNGDLATVAANLKQFQWGTNIATRGGAFNPFATTNTGG
jgi:hypothetical protein